MENSPFGNLKILVLGDVMLDKYTFGEVERISPEAPIPIVSVTRESFVPGGAANTANNISSLGGKAFLMGLVGQDAAGDLLISELQKRHIDAGGILAEQKRRTIQKIRIISQSQQLLRIDFDEDDKLEPAISQSLLDRLSAFVPMDAIIISDYAKGLVHGDLVNRALELAKKWNVPVLVDPKPQHQAWYRGATLLTPNKKEAEGMLGRKLHNDREIREAGAELVRTLDTNVLITLGEKGMALFERSGELTEIPAEAREVYDVSGAGDTVVATLALMLAAKKDIKNAARLANKAAGLKVAKFGTAPVSWKELKAHEGDFLRS